MERRQLVFTYKGRRRETCPHLLGTSAGAEKALVWQFAGGTTTALPPGGEWRCVVLAEVSDPALRDGAWHTGPYHLTTQRCVADVVLDANED